MAVAIREHYQPRFAGDALPSCPEAVAVALADKIETLVGMFGIGQLPTGEKDPFALRRHALGVLRMLIEKELPVSLDALVAAGFEVEQAVPGVKDASAELLNFFFDRLRVMMREAGYSAQEVEAVLVKRCVKLADIKARLAAVKSFTELPEAESLTAANKRIGNILKKIEGEKPTEVKPELFTEPAEKALYEALGNHEPIADALYEKGEFSAMLGSLTPLKTPVDTFFADVMVNAEDPAVRANRQALLMKLYNLMNRVAELSALAH